jgi:hypothetical protein
LGGPFTIAISRDLSSVKMFARLGDYHSVFLIKGDEERSIMACGSGSLL